MRRGRGKTGRGGIDAGLVRFGISIPTPLLKDFDQHLNNKKKLNRSDAIRDLIRGGLIQDAWSEGKGEQVMTVTLVYDGQNADLQRRLTDSKRAMGTHLLSGVHVRLGPRQELEVLVLRGPASAIRAEAETVRGLKGILHGAIVLTTTGE
jgi:CopG family nickel-responsive transcriptional regulator